MTATARPARLLTTLLALAALALVAAGCGGGDEPTKTYDNTPLGTEQKVTVVTGTEFDADQQEVIAAVADFSDATAQKDYKALCDKILTDASSQLGAGKCEAFLKEAGSAFKDFSVQVESVTISEDGKSATVKTTTTTDGKPAPTPYTLKKNDQGEWQISILGQ